MARFDTRRGRSERHEPLPGQHPRACPATAIASDVRADQVIAPLEDRYVTPAMVRGLVDLGESVVVRRSGRRTLDRARAEANGSPAGSRTTSRRTRQGFSSRGSGVTGEVVTEHPVDVATSAVRVADAAAPKFGHAPYSVTILSTVFFMVVTTEPGVSCLEAVRDTDPLPLRSATSTNELAAHKVHRAASEVGLTAGPGPVATAHRFRHALTEEVDLGRRVDRHHLRLLGDDARVVDPVDGQEVDGEVLVEEIIQTPAALRSVTYC